MKKNLNPELVSQLQALINETVEELDVLKKSSRFSASEYSFDKEQSEANGGVEKAEKEEDEEEEKEEKEKEKEKEEVEKAEDEKEEEKEDEDEDEEDDEKELEKAEKEMDDACKSYEMKKALYKSKLKEILQVAKPNWEKNKAKLLSPEQGKKLDQVKSEKSSMKKTESKEQEALLKTVKSLTEEVKSLKSLPMPQKGINIQNVKPLLKNANEGQGETLSKTEVFKELELLAKSGHDVSNDAIKLSNGTESAESIIKKYNIKSGKV